LPAVSGLHRYKLKAPGAERFASLNPPAPVIVRPGDYLQ
jgi:hypothetical protein